MSSIKHSFASSRPLNKKWQERFAFFEEHGGPQAPGFKAALQALPANKKRLISINIFAFFFGPVYLFALGMWRKNLSFLAIIIGVAVLEIFLASLFNIIVQRGLGSGINIVLALMYGLSTNHGYYLTRVKGSRSWNPFEGMRWV